MCTFGAREGGKGRGEAGEGEQPLPRCWSLMGPPRINIRLVTANCHIFVSSVRGIVRQTSQYQYQHTAHSHQGRGWLWWRLSWRTWWCGGCGEHYGQSPVLVVVAGLVAAGGWDIELRAAAGLAQSVSAGYWRIMEDIGGHWRTLVEGRLQDAAQAMIVQTQFLSSFQDVCVDIAARTHTIAYLGPSSSSILWYI